MLTSFKPSLPAIWIRGPWPGYPSYMPECHSYKYHISLALLSLGETKRIAFQFGLCFQEMKTLTRVLNEISGTMQGHISGYSTARLNVVNVLNTLESKETCSLSKANQACSTFRRGNENNPIFSNSFLTVLRAKRDTEIPSGLTWSWLKLP